MNEVTFGMNQYCGPAVLSIFTGLDTDTCAEKITEVSGRTSVTGVMPKDLILAGQKLGLEFKLNEAFSDRSLFWTASALVNFPGMYLITIPNHYISIEVLENKQIQICDNHTKTPLDLSSSSRLSQKVERVWKVTKVFDYIKPTIVSDEIEIQEITQTNVVIRQLITYSDGKVKILPLGTISAPDIKTMQQISHDLMEFTDNLD